MMLAFGLFCNTMRGTSRPNTCAGGLGFAWWVFCIRHGGGQGAIWAKSGELRAGEAAISISFCEPHQTVTRITHKDGLHTAATDFIKLTTPFSPKCLNPAGPVDVHCSSVLMKGNVGHFDQSRHKSRSSFNACSGS